MKTQTKIALIFFLILLSTIMVLSASVYFFTTRYSFTDFYKRLEIRGVVTARAELDHEEASQTVLQEVRELHLEKLPEEKEYFFKIEPGHSFDAEAAQLVYRNLFFQHSWQQVRPPIKWAIFFLPVSATAAKQAITW
jgi:hypothetical protein